jgi:F-type H+-transporting ATPase subunit epsilon
LHLEILVPDGVVLETAVSALQAADASGRFGLLPAHETILTVLVPCVLEYRDENGTAHYAAVDGGVLQLEDGCASIITSDAITAHRVEEVAAVQTMRDERRLQERSARAAFAELGSSLMRELGKVEQP